jgi:hypothetical protein
MWRNVNTNPPKDDSRCLIVLAAKQTNETQRGAREMYCALWRDGEWLNDQGRNIFNFSQWEVTHWQPYPELPSTLEIECGHGLVRSMCKQCEQERYQITRE